jgi:hypothetical protein
MSSEMRVSLKRVEFLQWEFEYGSSSNGSWVHLMRVFLIGVSLLSPEMRVPLKEIILIGVEFL